MKEPIAICGSACRFPGGSNSPFTLWDLLSKPRDALSDFPSDRLNLSRFHNTNGEHHGSTDVQNKSYLLSEDPRFFDAAFFSINPLEADGMDPQQRLLLETVYEAIESAGYTMEEIQGSQTSVFVGSMTADYTDIQMRDTETMPRYAITGTARSLLSNRISYFFDFRGESMTIDTACSSSLVALHEAVQSLRSGHCTTSVVAGVNLILDPTMYIGESSLRMLSSDARSRMWDESANGYARGEGLAAVYLKTLSQALKDGDSIESIIRETLVNSDGRTKGITMPSAAAQADLIRTTYRNAGLDPLVDRCQYFECHGTGTLAGDPQEAQAIQEAFFPEGHPDDDTKLLLGSIKTVIGHTEGCAGLGGVLKVSLAMRHHAIPPNMHFQKLNTAIKPYYGHLQVVESLTPWPKLVSTPLRASVNSFGFGGTNAHAILESYDPETIQVPTNLASEACLVGPWTFSAKTDDSLLALIQAFATYIRSNPTVSLDDLAWILQTKRTHHSHKAFFSGATRQRLLAFMDKHVEAAEAGVQAHPINVNEIPGVLGVFTGQGAQWASMGKQLILGCRLFRESIENCERSLACLPDAPTWSLTQELMADEVSSRLSEAALSQPLCTAIQIAMVDLIAAAGIKLDAAVGHSSGEIAATYAAGIISSSDAIRIAYYRGYHARLAQGDDGKLGAMMAVGLSFDSAVAFCATPQFIGRIGLAASNSPSLVTLSGDVDAIHEAKLHFDTEKVFARVLNVDTAYHSYHMLACAEPYLESLKRCDIKINPPKEDCIWISSVRGDVELLEGDLQTLKGQYWVDNMVQPVLFTQAVECALWNGGPFDMIVELGPHPALKGPTIQTIKAATGNSPPYAGVMRRADDPIEAFSGAVGYVWSHLGSGMVNFEGYRKAFNAPDPQMLKDLPSYAWDHKKLHWRESRISRNYRLRDDRPNELLGRRVPDDSGDEMRWRNVLRLSEIPWLRGHEFQGQVLFPGAGYVAMAMEASRRVSEQHAVKMVELQDISFLRALVVGESQAGVETVFTLRIIKSDSDIVEAEFACHACSDEASGSLEKRSVGRLIIHLGQPAKNELPPRILGRSTGAPMDMDRFFSSLVDIGLNYQGLFKGLKSATRKMGHATASALWSKAEMDQQHMLHPAFLDSAFHAVFAAFSSPASGALWTPYLPVKIRRLVMDPNITYESQSEAIVFDVEAFVIESSSTFIKGDIDLYNPRGNTGVQIEGLFMKSFSEPGVSNDRLLFAETCWTLDTLGGFASVLEEKQNVEEHALVDAIERTALHYFQHALDAFKPDEIPHIQWYHQRLFEAVNVMLTSVRNGHHPVVKRQWLADSRETILAMKKEFPGQIDLEIMNAIGQNLVSVIRGDTQLLEVMLENDMLNRFYMEGRGFRYLNDCIARVAKQITSKHPHAKILEIGAGTGGTTKSLLGAVGDAYSQYTYTDISSGFFEKAAQKFADSRSKFTFKILDIEKDIAAQGFEKQSYDIVIASNVLHATRKLNETLQHTRGLLRPGGYLILVEVTGDLLRMPFLMGGLPGWWLGTDEGRRLSPGVSPVKWDELLQATGFSGVDNIVHDMPDPIKHSCSVIVSQAVDEKFQLLRDPLSSVETIRRGENLLIIGGKTLPVIRKIREIEKLLFTWKDRITVVSGIDELKHLAPRTSVICLTELDKPLFSDLMTPDRIAKLQDLFTQSTNILWITAGRLCGSPLSNMTVGVGRALMTELPQINLQFIDVGTTSSLDPRTIVEAFLRLALSASPEYVEYDALWITEPELAFDGQATLIPRIMMDKAINDRFNADRRLITREINTDTSSVELVSFRGSSTLQLKPSFQHAPTECIKIHVKYSVALPVKDGMARFLCLGTIHGTEESAFAMSHKHSSSIDVASEDVFVTQFDGVGILKAVASQLLAGSLYSVAPIGGTVLIYEAEEVLAEAIMHNTQWKGRKFVFASARQGKLPEDWIPIHPQSSRRTIKHILPGDIACVLDLSKNSHDKIKESLSNLLPVYTFEPSLLQPSDLAKAVVEAVSLDQAKLQDVIPVQDLVGTSSSGIYPNVIDWSCKSLVVAIKPLDTSGLFHSTKTYFLVGLTGELGRSLCQWMVSNNARYIALGSRSADVDPLWLEEMHALGAIIKVYKMDVSNRDDVVSVHAAIKDAMPPIGGVCNAAMVLFDKLFVDMNADTMNKVLKPKVDGTVYLDELFNGPSLDFFIMFSSLASVIGNGGQSNYHAANLFMASLAAQRRNKGLAASVINIGMVVDVGYVARTGRSIEDHLRKLFYMPLSETDIHHLFAEAVLASPADSNRNFDIIMGIEPFIDSADAKIRPPWFSNPRFSHFVRADDASEEQQQTTSSQMHIRQQLDTVESEEDASTLVQTTFKSKLETMMQLAPGSVDAKISLLDLGCDSLLAVEIRTWFLKEVHVDVPVLKVLSGDTIADICGEVARKYLALKQGRSQESLVRIEVAQDKENNEASSELHVDEDKDESPTPDSEEDPGSADTKFLPSTANTSFPPSPRGLAKHSYFPSPAIGLHPQDMAHFKRVEKMSLAQSRIWFLRKFLRDQTAYNITVSYDIQGPLQIPRFKRALDSVVSHHESLQTCFFAKPQSGELMQGILTAPSYTLKHLYAADEEDVKREFDELARTAWSLEQGESFKTTLLTQSPTQHTIIFGYHHIVMDGVSWGLFLRDLNLAYRMTPLKALARQSSDFAVQQFHSIENGKFEEQISFWEREHSPLADTLPLLPFARVKGRTAADTYNGHTTRKEVNNDLVAKIKRATQTLRVTPFHYHLTVIQVLLTKLLDIEDLCIGITDANRADEEFSDTVGFFLNLLPLRFRVHKESQFSDLAKQTSKKIYAALSNSQVPFDLILDRLNVPRSSSHSPLFQVAVNYRMGDMMQTQLGDLQLKLANVVDAKSPYDVVFNITQNSGGLCLLEITCRDSFYDSQSSDLLMDMYLRLLDDLATDTSLRIEECSLYDTLNAKNAIDVGRGPRIDFGRPSTLVEMFDNIQQQHGDDIAVKDSSGHSTYAQLAMQVRGIVATIIGRGLAAKSRVAVLCQPSVDSVACMLAVLRAGCVYVPLDLSLPRSRHAAIIGDCKPSLVLCHHPTLDLASEFADPTTGIVSVSAIAGVDQINSLALSNSPAFLLYTSGSTGTPKGISLSHAGFINYVASKTTKLGLTKEVVLQQSSSGFDMSIAQMFIALANGGTLVMAPQSARGDPVEITRLMLKEKVTFTIGTPSEYLMLLRNGNDNLKRYSAWRNACLGGEAVSEQVKREFSQLNPSAVKLTDCYGPTEISACTTLETVSLEPGEDRNGIAHGSVGKAIPNTSIYILDEASDPVPIGFPGEIVVGGVGVALGYHGLPELNGIKFLPDPFATAEDAAKGWTTMYKTGDKGRLAQNGSLIFMGRKDDDTQIKLRGLRIELDEVANTLIQTSQGLLSEAVVSVRGDPEFLIAHVVFAPGKSLSEAETDQLGKSLPLPQYMHPAMTIPLELLPTNSNGKTDRKAISVLPLPVRTSDPDLQRQKPLTLTEGQLKLVWKDVLQTASTQPLTPESDFFMTGGNSLLLVKVQSAIKDSFGVAISINDLYQSSTLGTMATRITAEQEQQPEQELIDWNTETNVSESMRLDERHQRPIKDYDIEILLTGATSFLGSAILSSLLEDHRVRRIHCIAVPAEGEKYLPHSDKIKKYPGSLMNATLSLSKSDILLLESSIDVILHAGAFGHCLNNYSSLRVPNVHSTHFLAGLAQYCGIPLHFLSSNRVTLLSNSNALPPVSVTSHPPARDGSEGFTASKWASECFLEKVAKQSGVAVWVHRPCAVIGESAPSEDALNALLRYSILMRAVPRFENFDGFFDFDHVSTVAAKLVRNVLEIRETEDKATSMTFKHYSGGIKTPVSDFRLRMEQIHGGPFAEIQMSEWIERARGFGIENLIVTYLEAIMSRGETISFPYLGEAER